jgi:hypothetical protein
VLKYDLDVAKNIIYAALAAVGLPIHNSPLGLFRDLVRDRGFSAGTSPGS